MNERLLKLAGCRRERLIGNTSNDLLLWEQPELVEQWFERLARNEEVREENTRFRNESGALRDVLVSLIPMTLGGHSHVLLLAQDITERLSLERQLLQAQKMESIGQLAAGVAHDFNNILSVLLMQTELVDMTEPLPEEARAGLHEIRGNVNRAAEITRQLLLFSRRQVMQPRVLELNGLVSNLAKMLQRFIREDVRLQMQLHPSPLKIRADAGMLEQVLMNLAVNSRDAMTGAGRLHIETTEVTVDENAARLNPDAIPGHYVCLSVSDTGGGIPPEVLPRIFEPFFTTKEIGKGTGLGLATVFGIVKQHQGWIQVDNRLGDGVTFKIFLPTSPETALALTETQATLKPRGGTETILLVEDELALLKSTRTFLNRHGYTVLEAINGPEALKLWEIHRGTVALLLTDIVMPGGLSGHDLARRLQLEAPGLKVIFVSGYSADLSGRDLKSRPGKAFIQKPFATDHLLKTIRHCLEG